MNKKTLHMVAFVLLVIGGLNWLLLALFNWEIGMLTNSLSPVLTKAIYILVGLAAVYEIMTHKQQCKTCDVHDSARMMS